MAEVTELVIKDLLKAAEEAKETSYSPYSKFRVGACLLTKSGKFVKGCNVENASYGLTICAERTALCKMVSEGEVGGVKVVAISTDVEDNAIWPCGACLQCLVEFCSRDTVVYHIRPSGKVDSHKLRELIPFAFTTSDLDLPRAPSEQIIPNVEK